MSSQSCSKVRNSKIPGLQKVRFNQKLQIIFGDIIGLFSPEKLTPWSITILKGKMCDNGDSSEMM
jgi:hypothetical protein